MYQALYRKYRPQTFSDVCGQEHITQTLKTQIADKRWSHAYLFTGSRGTGKTTSAKILSKAVNCLNPHNGDPCNECEICKGIDNGSILDVVEIDAASNRGVDDIRDLREQIEYSPSKTKFRVYIIDEVHMLTKEAFNALLKTLEEPPAHALFILATTEVWEIPATILSRCQRYDFNRISAEIITARIKYICDEEQIKIEDNAAMLIAKLADGGMRDALSLLDLCAGTSKDISEKLVADCAGLIGKDYIYDLISLVEQKKPAEILTKLDELYSSSCDMERLMTELIGHCRDLLIAKTSKNYRSMITATNENLDKIEQQSKQVKFENIMYYTDKFSACLESMKKGTSKRICVETTLIRLCTNELDTSASALLKRISKLEEAVATGNVLGVATVKPQNVSMKQESQNKEKQATALSGSPVKSETSSKPINNGEIVKFTKWAEALEIIKKSSPIIHAVLNNSVAYISGAYLLIDAPNPTFSETIRGESRYRNDIKKAVYAVTGEKYNLGPYNRKTAVVKKENDPLEDLISDLGNDITIEN